MLDLIWIQTTQYSKSVPERFFLFFFFLKVGRRKKIVKNYPACKELEQYPGFHIFIAIYKNLSCEDRQICPKDSRLASQGLPSDDKQRSQGTDFSILPSRE